MTRELTVGLEVHVELETTTKMFCGCKNDPFNAEPNTHVCPVCYGLPGALPLLNKKAIEMTVGLGQALNGKIAPKTFWARKNYFYPDLPKGYQISQSTAPLVERASIVIEGQTHRITRIHLEEDAGKLTHDTQGKRSLVDYNRAGVPLLEMVTEPDFHTAEAAKHFCQELQRLVRHLKISRADMEKGQMRCEANISIAAAGAELGTKVEVKNLNSFRSVERAINYEFARQTKLLDEGKTVAQETRLWDEKKGETAVMRGKETSADYRYFPEPDLPMVSISLGKATGSLVLPDEQRTRLAKLGMSEAIAKIIVDRQEFDSIMETYAASSKKFKDDDKVKFYTLEDGKMRAGLPKFSELNASDRLLLLEAKNDQGWSKSMFESLVAQVLDGETAEKLVAARKGTSGDIDPEAVAQEVIKANPKALADYKAGKVVALNFLVGQVMTRTKGQINVTVAQDTIRRLLG
ncbi:MAG: Asp-tRNA(Asn)/Glu-tRNA(Gln) amidotransferase subunit GatB [Candidatus Berkelbacteria bacterium]|nr:MAG: Asp-tRNA(Asn)/Glu-tRNA(Gln) amidotransferase subunit GatB [Candidatus Berkelbacteria bacterium]QQG51554.1 MAG: Asp-tRNA(Asn)/Glu-tRNA(Gln) amidotransferase subunit GatB [Candidatus Berkelbacteria bacterium]